MDHFGNRGEEGWPGRQSLLRAVPAAPSPAARSHRSSGTARGHEGPAGRGSAVPLPYRLRVEHTALLPLSSCQGKISNTRLNSSRLLQFKKWGRKHHKKPKTFRNFPTPMRPEVLGRQVVLTPLPTPARCRLPVSPHLPRAALKMG